MSLQAGSPPCAPKAPAIVLGMGLPAVPALPCSPSLVSLHVCTKSILTPRSGRREPSPDRDASPDKNQATSVLGKQAHFLAVTEKRNLIYFSPVQSWEGGVEGARRSFCFYFNRLKPQPSVSFTALHAPEAQYCFPAPRSRSLIINIVAHGQVVTMQGGMAMAEAGAASRWEPMLWPPPASPASRTRVCGQGNLPECCN